MKWKILCVSAAVVLCAAIICAPLTSCREEEAEEPIEEKVAKKISAYKTDLLDSAETMTDVAGISSYLVTWAEAKSIACSTDAYGNIIMSNPGSEEYAEAPRTVVVCTFDPLQFEFDVNAIAPALYIAKNCSGYGPVDVIFTPQTGGDLSGPKTLSASYFPEGSSVFVLSSASKSLWSNSSGGYSSYVFTGDIAYDTISQDQKSGYSALKISISGLPGEAPDAGISTYFNPVKELGTVLANFKTKAKVFRVASFTGGTASGINPSSAEVTIVVGRDTLSSVEKMLDNEISRITGRYGEDLPDLLFAYEETEVPDRVLNESSNNLFVTAVYTLLDGIYQQNNNSGADAITNLGKVSISDTQMIFEATGCSLGTYDLVKLDNDYATLCSLTGLSYSVSSTHEMWFSSEENEDYASFLSDIKKAQDSFGGHDSEWGDCVQPTAATMISDVARKCNMVNFVADSESSEECAGTIVLYMAGLPHESDE